MPSESGRTQRPFTIRAIATTADILRLRHTAKSRTWAQEADAYIAELPHPTPKRDIEMVRSAAEWLERMDGHDGCIS